MSNAAGAFSSILMTLPLIAVPCLAVFGLPSIGPASAEAEAEDASLELGVGDKLAAPSTLGTPQNSASFSPIVDAGGEASLSEATPFQAASSDQPAFDRTSRHRDAAANTAAGLDVSANVHEGNTGPPGSNQPPAGVLGDASGAAPTETAFRDPAHEHHEHGSHEHGSHEHAADAAAESGPSWETSLAKLNALGIRDFHLTNSEVPGQFYFSCSLPGAGRNVTRRFEAEAATPVAAAEDVLQQVLACRASR